MIVERLLDTAPRDRRVKRSVVVAALGTAQTLAWGSSYYLPAILADPIAHGLGLSRTTVFGLFSGALLLSAVLGPSVGRAIDNRGGRGVLALSNLVLAAGLVLLGVAQGFFTLALAWAVLGVGMAMGLYDPAFATLTGLYGRAARGPITGITLIAGFASTVGWPLSAFLDAQFGWRDACLIWAALHIVIGLPLEPAADPARAAAGPRFRGSREKRRRRRAARWRSSLSSSPRPGLSPAPWPRICRACSKSPAPARRPRSPPLPWSDRRRSRARLVEFGALRMVHPLVSARLAALLHPIGAVILAADRARRDHRFRGVAWRRQWSADDRQGNRAAGDLRAGRLRAAQRHPRRAGARDAGGIAAALRPFDGSHGHRRAGDLGRPQPERFVRAAAVEGTARGGAGAGIIHGAGSRHDHGKAMPTLDGMAQSRPR